MRRLIRILWIAALLCALCLAAGHAAEDLSQYATLEKGDEGREVLRFKQAMYYLGYFKTLNVSNVYNATTVERVMQLQEKNGLEPTGVATPELQALVFSGQCVPSGTQPKPTVVPTPSPTPVPVKTPKPLPSAPPLDENGFLDESAGLQEFIHADSENGLWLYYTDSLAIELKRFEDVENDLIWFEGDIRCSEETPLKSYLTQGKTPGKNFRNPIDFSRLNDIVLAVTDDYFGFRIDVNMRLGIVIREGVIIADKTYANDRAAFPNLEVLAVFADGSMKTFKSNDHTAQEYLDMGAVNVFSFGPVLVTEGEYSDHMLKEDYYTYREPRCALGMIEPYHYMLLVVEGRNGESKGTYLTWLADKMLEKGVTEALNLDGGGTVALLFMGELLNKSTRNVRQITSLIGFGNSSLVPAEN